MSDSDFVDVGDELVVKISGYPIGKARVIEVSDTGVDVEFNGKIIPKLPLDIKQHDTVDGYGHHSQPLDGTQSLEG